MFRRWSLIDAIIVALAVPLITIATMSVRANSEAIPAAAGNTIPVSGIMTTEGCRN